MEYLRTGHAMLLHLCKHGYGCYGERIDGVEAGWSASNGVHGVDFLLCKLGAGYIASFRCVENNDALLSCNWTLCPCPYFRDGQAHVAASVTDVYAAIRDEATDLMAEHVRSGRRVIFCGYSLGAAVAAVAAVDHVDFFSPHPHLITYGSPCIGDRRFAQAVASSCSMAEDVRLPDDPVVYFPSDKQYCRFGLTRRLGGHIPSLALNLRMRLLSLFAILAGRSASWPGETVMAADARCGIHDIREYISAVSGR
jgi:pimeloyl-ACP methyl ester carboxylesterase